MVTKELVVRLKTEHPKQAEIRQSQAKRIVCKMGRRFGKTTLAAMIAVDRFLDGRRVLYAAPTQDQTDKFWREVTNALKEPIDEGIYYINQTRRFIEIPGTENRIRAKTAWDENTLRGDYADYLILDEYQQMKPTTWTLVGAPMLLDNDGDAMFIYTVRRGEAGTHARALFKRAQGDESGRYAAFEGTSHDNPHLSNVALAEITEDMSHLDYQMEIMAIEMDEDPEALWTREMIEETRTDDHPDLHRIMIAVDPPGKATGAKCGIVVGGIAKVGKHNHVYILSDKSRRGRPDQWGGAVVRAYHRYEADRVIGEVNNGGDMVESTVRMSEGGENIPFTQVRASRGKMTRAEPVANLYAEGRVHHVGVFQELEDQMCHWVPGMQSPDELDAAVWLVTKLLLVGRGWSKAPAGV
jgi:hypothetical protein